MAVRRSARLRSTQSPVEDTPTDLSNQSNANTRKPNNLEPVMERDEAVDTPANHQSTPSKVAHTPKADHSQKKSPAKTPTTCLTRPNHFEMHPSKAHQSTTKQADSGLILGFNPVKKDAQGNVVRDPAQNTPSKTNASPASAYYGTPAFDFKFSSEDSQLSDEAKKLMESVREDVARIKANMVHDKSTGASNEVKGERKFAKPRGKAGRFSDVHMAEFKKMDSIAGHASAFRATPGRFQPVQKTLKRTNSKARLNEAEDPSSPARATPEESTPTTPSAKRVKQSKPDTPQSSFTPQSRLPSVKSATARPKSSIRSSLLTPTRSSMARASGSLKPPRTTMIPSLGRSPLSKPEAPSTPKTEFNPRFKSNIPTLSSLKSILRRHQPLFSKDPSKIAAGTHQAAPDFKPELLLQPSRESSPAAAPTPSPKKRVEFTPCTKTRQAEEVASPSPSKLPVTITYPTTSDVVYPALPALTPDSNLQSPTIPRSARASEVPAETEMPEVPGMPHGLSHKKRNRANEETTGQKPAPTLSARPSEAPAGTDLPEVPGMPHGLSHKKKNRATEDKAGVDKPAPSPSARASEVPAETDQPEVPGMPHGLSHKKRNRATEDNAGRQKHVSAPPAHQPQGFAEAALPEVPGMPHGLSHKKRHRAAEDDTDRENVPPNDEPSLERSAKRVKMNAPEPHKLSSSPLKSRSHTPSRPGSARKGTPASARSKSRVLSMSRLNLLSQPKNRS